MDEHNEHNEQDDQFSASEYVVEQKVVELTNQLRSGANWFYWIAGFSVVNYLLMVFGGDLNFIVGLGITTIAGAILQVATAEVQDSIALVLKLVGLLVSLAAAGLFAMFGWFAGKNHIWAFIVGMALYALDGMLFVLVGDWLSVGFHAFALFCLYGGLTAARQLAAFRDAVAASDADAL